MRSSSSLGFASFLYFVFGFCMSFKIIFIGEVFATELIFVVCFLCFLLFVKQSNKYEVSLYLMLGVWLFAQMVSDWANGTEWGDFFRGTARIVFLAINAFVLFRLLKTKGQFLLFLVGFSFSVLLRTYLEFPEFQTFWKFGGCFFSLLAICSLVFLFDDSVNGKVVGLIAVVCMSFALISLLNNCRSAAVGCISAALIILYAHMLKKRKQKISRLSTQKIIIGVFVVMASGYLFALGYSEAAGSGLLGEEARHKYEVQSFIGLDPVIGLILGGRSEILASYHAITDAPILGHGSWAKDIKYTYIYLDTLDAMGRSLSESSERSLMEGAGLIPTHSHILGAWVDAGILGVVFWFFVLKVVLKQLVSALSLTDGLDAIFLVMSFWLIWDILFSPFGGMMRMWWALVLVLCITRQYGAAFKNRSALS